MRSRGSIAICALAACLTIVGARDTAAASILVNGGFEAGFAGWTRVDQAGGNGTFFLQSGTASPVNGTAVPAPPEGTIAAMTDQMGPGSHVLYQDFVVPVGLSAASLSFDVFIGNRNGLFFSPATLDFTAGSNQQARVDIITTTADPFSVAPADVLLNVFQTQPGDTAVFPAYSTDTTDLLALLTANAGNTLRLRFAEVDNQFFFQMGVDNVKLDVTTAVPEPATTFLIGTGLLGLAIRRRK